MNVVEKFSDFGQELRSHKYKGRTAYVRGHVLVFANRPPPERIAHRCVTVHTQDPSYNDYDNPEKIPYYADGARESSSKVLATNAHEPAVVYVVGM